MVQVEILEQKGFDFLWITDAGGPCLWMWAIPEEARAQKHMADQAFGDVLVAGYGLGMVQEALENNKRVNSVVTIELHREVIEACWERYKITYGELYFGDFYKIKPNNDFKFDCVIGDIWKDIIPEALDDYKRFKARAQYFLKPSGKIIAWGQELFEYLIEKEKNM